MWEPGQRGKERRTAEGEGQGEQRDARPETTGAEAHHWLHVVAPATPGVSSDWFVGSQEGLEFFFGSLRLLRLRNLSYDGTRATNKLMPQCARTDGMCEKTHTVITDHIDRLGLRRRGLARTHPGTIEGVHFALFRNRGNEVEARPSKYPSVQCDGQTRRCLLPSSRNETEFFARRDDLLKRFRNGV